MRNKEKDEAQIALKKQRLIEVGFRLFAEKGIEQVKIPDIADASGVPRASIYRYFETKLDLVTEIGTWKWKECIAGYAAELSNEEVERMTGAEYLRWYLDTFIDLYRNHRDILRFNYYFNSYLQNEHAQPDQKGPYLKVITDLQTEFHELYEKGMRDGTIRKDISEQMILSSSFHIMLAAVTRYAVGLVYVSEADPEEELIMLENLLISRYTVS